MIDKQDFYFGAAIVRILEHPKVAVIQKHEFGYVVNSSVFVFLKYSTNARSPWGFNFSDDEVLRLISLVSTYEKTVIGLICGGDGICAIEWERLNSLLVNKAGWISVKRNFKKRYGISGPLGWLDQKIPLLNWPSLLFE